MFAAALPLLALVLDAAPEVRAPAPAGVDAVRTAFARVGVGAALEAARACAATQPRACQPVLKRLEAFAALARTAASFTAPQAQQLLLLDREISPGAPAEITRRIHERFVAAPLDLARYHLKSGNVDGARIIARQVLEADPANAEALELAGPPADALAPSPALASGSGQG